MDVQITSDNKKELGKLCREVGLIADGTESLPRLVENVLHRHLPKPAADRISPWDDMPLSESQIAYAAADAAASLMVYEVAVGQPDLTTRCKASHLTPGMHVDIVPSCVMQMSAVMADAQVIKVGSSERSPPTWTNPLNGDVVKLTATRCLVQVTEVHAPSFQLNAYAGTIGEGFINKRPCKLGDFVSKDVASAAFEIVLNVHNLAPHSATRFRPRAPLRMDVDSRDSSDAADSSRGRDINGGDGNSEDDTDDDTDDDDEGDDDVRRKRRKGLDRLSLDPFDRSVMSQLDIRRVAMQQIAATLRPSDAPEEHIDDVFVSWPGNIFHALFRIGKHVSRKHAMRRPFLMSLRDVRLGHRDLANFLRAVAEACSPHRFRVENAVVRYISLS